MTKLKERSTQKSIDTQTGYK